MSLSIRTKSKKSSTYQYKKNLDNVIVFLENPDDKILFKDGDVVKIIDIYENDKLIFSGDKTELFNLLKKK